MKKNQLRFQQIQDWMPACYENLDLYMTVDEEENAHPYSWFRKWQIGREQQLNEAKGSAE